MALAFLVEKIKLEQECDVCHAVRMVRQNREQFVPNFVSTLEDIPHSKIQRALIPFFLPSYISDFTTEVITCVNICIGSKCGI